MTDQTGLFASGRLWLRPLLLCVLLFIELMFLSFALDAYSQRLSDSDRWFSFLAYAGDLGRFAVVFFAAFVLIMWRRINPYLDSFKKSQIGHRSALWFFLQLLSFSALFILSVQIFGVDPGAVPSPVVVVWLTVLLTTAGSWLLCLAPWFYWRNFLYSEKVYLAYSALVALVALATAKLSQYLWMPLTEMTFEASARVLGLFNPDIVVDAERKLLGIDQFVVNIARACSGFEGIGLVIVFTAIYLSVYRKEFRFPQALLLFPIGIVSIWSFNVLRIVLLIGIGENFSEQVAVGGFHSQAGWIFFLLVIFGLLVIAHKLPFFTTEHSSSAVLTRSQEEQSLPSALIIPFVVLLASVIVTSALSADFVWLYPVRVIAVAIALGLCWKTYAFSRLNIRFEPVVAGFFVFLVWFLIVPNDEERNQVFAAELSAVPGELMILWIAFRFLGSVLTVPIAEELVFRGYLFSRLGTDKTMSTGKINFSWKALLLSSILFGFLHQAFLAGVLAGLVYGLVRYRGSSVLDAVVAHSVTNFLLSLLVITTGSWSYW